MHFSKMLHLCLIAMVLGQRTREAQPAGLDTEKETETATAAPKTSNQSMGPIGAGIGFSVCFLAVVLYLCKKDYDEKKEEKEKAAAEAKALEEGAAEEQKPQQVGAGDGVELASLETTDGQEANDADRV